MRYSGRRHYLPCVVVLGALLLACGPEPGADPEGPSPGQPVHYEEIHGTEGLARQVSVCELFAEPLAPRVAVVQIEDIIGSIDEVAGGLQPRYHVHSRVEEVWFGDVPEQLEIVLVGGAWRGVVSPPAVSFAVGERVVLLLRHDDPLVPNELRVFREIGSDRFSNGQLFAGEGIELSLLYDLLVNVRSTETCPYPEDFGLTQDPEWGPGPDGDEVPADLGP